MELREGKAREDRQQGVSRRQHTPAQRPDATNDAAWDQPRAAASPPYYAITNYHYDQWLRLWLLGGPPNALRSGGAVCGKFEHRQKYRDLLHGVFSRAAELLADDATVYVRTD